VNKTSSFLWDCVTYTALYSARRWFLSAETCCCKMFKIMVNSSCVRLYLLLLYLLDYNKRRYLASKQGRKYNIEYVSKCLPRVIRAFLASALYGGKWSFVHGEEYRYPVERRVVGAHRGMKSEFPLEIGTQFDSLVTTILIELHLFILNF